ncbi:MAG: 3-keto-disaccharide hydrolase [Candidatus Zipacnadales bacterium]
MLTRATTIALLMVFFVPIAMAFTQPGQQELADPFIGDWQGTLRAADGTESPIVAQVINWGQEGYQANLLPAFDQRVPPLAVLKGLKAGDAIVFGNTARIEGGIFSGQLTGDRPGRFQMEHIVRLSPTLGAPPPEDAVVLFDGTNLDAWRMSGNEAFVVDLAKLVGGNNRAVYLRSRVTSPRAQRALLEVGSDDAIVVWVNGQRVHSNKVFRPVTPWEDQVEINLNAGENVLLLKVVQGSGGWGACARIRGLDGKDIEGLAFEPAPLLGWDELTTIQAGSTGTILTWELAGPYTEEGKDANALFDTAFPPEEGAGEAVEWKVINEKPQPKGWRLTGDGAMEIVPGTGSIVSKQEFGDHEIHLEFCTPFEPNNRGQGRGNSGVYIQARYEIQVLDSYGLEGRDNECGGIYNVGAPVVNMCAPPLQWHTYNIKFRAPRFANGQRVEPARITVYHNGVLVHDNVEIPGSTPGGAGEDRGDRPIQTGGILLQDHGNRVRYRNIWVRELPAE